MNISGKPTPILQYVWAKHLEETNNRPSEKNVYEMYIHERQRILKPVADQHGLSVENYSKTIMGMITSLHELFENYIYCRQYHSTSEKRYYTPTPERHVFLKGDEERVQTWLGGGVMKGALYVKAKPDVARWTLGGCMGGGFQSFHIIPWKHKGVALITATDSVFIASPWVAFIPLDKLPEINSDNTPIWDGKPLPLVRAV